MKYNLLNASITAVQNGDMLEEFNPLECRKVTHKNGVLRSDEEMKEYLDYLVKNGVLKEV